MESFSGKPDFKNSPLPSGRTPLACERMVGRLRDSYKDDIAALRAGMPLPVADDGTAAGNSKKSPVKRKPKAEGAGADGSPKKRKSKGEAADADGTPKKRGRKPKKAEPQPEIQGDDEEEEELGGDVKGEEESIENVKEDDSEFI